MMRVLSIVMIALFLSGCSIPRTDTQTDVKPILFPDGKLTILADSNDIKSQARCVEQRVRQRASESERLIPSHDFRAAFYPWFEISTAPTSLEEFFKLLQTTPVSEKLEDMQVRYIVTVSGETLRHDPEGGIVPIAGYGSGGFFGYMKMPKTSGLSAVIWDVKESVFVGELDSQSQGSDRIVAFVLPVPIFSMTETNVCEALSKALMDTFGLNLTRGYH